MNTWQSLLAVLIGLGAMSLFLQWLAGSAVEDAQERRLRDNEIYHNEWRNEGCVDRRRISETAPHAPPAPND